MHQRIFSRFLIWLLLALTMPPGMAAPAAPAAEAAPAPTDTLGRETPRSTVAGLIGALAELDYDRAALYFDVPTPTTSRIQNSKR